ncbi:MAG: hypothetical protein VYE54_14125 [Pseudomonadota bacterium]|nr:hypothetical protein [Pseudomonadota bacterium]
MNRVNQMRRFFLLINIVLLTACTSQNVLFFKELDAPPVHKNIYPNEHVIRVYLDRYGDLYPEGENRIPSQAVVLLEKNEPAAVGNVLSAFYEQADICLGDNSPIASMMCPVNGSPIYPYEENKENCDAGYTKNQRVLDVWRSVQDILWAQKIEEVISSQAKLNGPVVLLIHGFNVPDAEPSYVIARSQVRRFLPQGLQPLFIQIHWDGLSGFPVPWAKAQFNAPLVGLKLRRLLNSINGSVPVRILTHSSGGIVAASLIGDASQSLPCANAKEGVYHEYRKWASLVNNTAPLSIYRVPAHLTDFRVGMLAAAAPEVAFGGRNEGKGVLISSGRLIFGMNPSDEIVTKGFNLESWDFLGNTEMATGGKAFAAFYTLQKKLALTHPALELVGINFADSQGCNKRGRFAFWRESHDFSAYLCRDQIELFMQFLL